MDADVAYPFTGSTLMVDILILVRIPWGFGDGNEINRTAIAAWGTGFGMRAGIDMFAFKGAAVFTGIFEGIVSLGAHFVSGFARGRAFFIESNIIRSIF